MLLIAEELANCLREEKVKAEYFPIEVFFKGKPYQKRNFFFMHILVEVDCFDFEQSIYERDEDGFMDTIDKLVLNEQKIGDEKLFFIANISNVILCIADPLAEKLTEAGCTRISFVNLLEFHQL